MKVWLPDQLEKSTARWKIVVTHFPCGHEWNFYTWLHEKKGLDFLVTGHKHRQEIRPVKYLPCIVTGGGGGVTSEGTPGTEHKADYDTAEYGFFDLVFTRDTIKVQLIALSGNVIESGTIIHGSFTSADGVYNNTYNTTKWTLGSGQRPLGAGLENHHTFKEADPGVLDTLTDGMDPGMPDEMPIVR
jgi:hypothetical protein